MTLQNVFGDLALDATSAQIRDNVATATARLEAIRDRLPAALDADGGLKVHLQNPIAGGATETTLAALLTELGQKLEPGGQVALDAATLAALENIVVSGTVALDAATLAALESITVVDGGGSLTVDGTVALDAASLAALETITIANPTTNPETGLAKDATLTASVGAAADAEATGNGSAIALLKRLRTLLNGGLPAALAAGGGFKVEGVAGGVAQPVSGTVTANAGTGPFPVSDNGGSLTVDDGASSLTVDAPVGTPVAVRTSDGAAFIDPRDTSDRAARELGRTRLWDGTDEATVIPRGGSPASTDKGLAVMPLISGRPVYQLVTPERTMPTLTAAALDYLLTLWHPASLAKDVFIVEIGVNIRGVQTAGAFGFELSFMTAEAGTPGGTTVTPQPLSLGNALSGLTCRSAPAAPTLGGQIFQRASFPLPAAATPLVGPGAESLIVFKAASADDAIVLRSGNAEGLALRTNVLAAITTAPIYNAYCRFVERA